MRCRRRSLFLQAVGWAHTQGWGPTVGGGGVQFHASFAPGSGGKWTLLPRPGLKGLASKHQSYQVVIMKRPFPKALCPGLLLISAALATPPVLSFPNSSSVYRFLESASHLQAELEKLGVTEETVLRDFETWRQQRYEQSKRGLV